jgi:hypothetical protein
MLTKKIICLLFVMIALPVVSKAQFIGFRIAANSGMLISEFGNSDVPHSDAISNTPAQSTERFTPQLSYGLEGEVLFQISEREFFGVEVDYSNLRGYNDNPPYYNYYLTPYFDNFQPDGYILESPIKYNTTLINVAVNYKYFFFTEKTFQPFVKITGVVAFVGTDLTYKDFPSVENVSEIDPNLSDYSINAGADVLYARGTSNSDQKKWPAFHGGFGVGFSYDISDKLAFQADATATVVNSGIINGVPNFTYNMDENLLKYNRRLSLTTQLSAGLVYYIEVETGRRGRGGKTDPNLPFYLKKR